MATRSARLDGKPIGYVTSGSPSLSEKEHRAGLCAVDRIAPGTEVAVEIRGNLVKAKVVPHPVLPARQKTAYRIAAMEIHAQAFFLALK